MIFLYQSTCEITFILWFASFFFLFNSSAPLLDRDIKIEVFLKKISCVHISIFLDWLSVYLPRYPWKLIYRQITCISAYVFMKNNICNLLELYLDDKTGNLTWILRGIIAPYCLFMSRVHICGCWLDSLNPYEAIVYIANLGARGGATRAPNTS